MLQEIRQLEKMWGAVSVIFEKIIQFLLLVIFYIEKHGGGRSLLRVRSHIKTFILLRVLSFQIQVKSTRV